MRHLAGIVGAVILLAVAAPAAAQGTGDATRVEVDEPSAPAGEAVTVRGSGWRPGTPVSIRVDEGQDLGGTTVDRDGRFEEQITLPGELRPGTAGIEISGTDRTGSETSFVVDVQVTGQTRGTYVWVAVSAGLILLVLLVSFVLVRARRRRPESLAERARAGETPVRNPDRRKPPQPKTSS